MSRPLLLLLALAILLRLPFLNQAIQGDDVYYLAGAEHAQIDPLHPNHARYPFLGDIVDMRGHPHPPLDAWALAALLAILGTVSEVPFHAAYIVFTLIAAASAYSIARRLTSRPFEAALLFLATPALLVNGNSLEADVPFLAFWLASIACFLAAASSRRPALLAVSLLPMALAALAAYQAVLLTPLLWLYCYQRCRNWKPAWLAALGAPVTLAVWQMFERASTGGLPAAVLAGYLSSYNLEAFAQKIKNAGALTAHLGWVVFLPLSIAAFFDRRFWWLALPAAAAALYDPNPLWWLSFSSGLLILAWCLLHARRFAAQWIILFFAASLVMFFAGSARYLLPLALPVALLVSEQVPPRWLRAGAAAGFALGLALAAVNYQHWDAYRRFARSLPAPAPPGRVWINGEWGLRFYLEQSGGLPLLRNQPVQPGDVVVASALAYPLPVSAAGAALVPMSQATIAPSIPLRLISLGGRAAWSTTLNGLRPFDISRAPIDRISADSVIERLPSLSSLPMNAPEAASQLISGFYNLEDNRWRWMSRSAVVALKSPAPMAAVRVVFNIPDASPARRLTVLVDGKPAADQYYSAPGTYTLVSKPISLESPSAIVTLTADRAFTPPNDLRALSFVILSVSLAAP